MAMYSRRSSAWGNLFSPATEQYTIMSIRLVDIIRENPSSEEEWNSPQNSESVCAGEQLKKTRQRGGPVCGGAGQ